jgi:hypothetical protein
LDSINNFEGAIRFFPWIVPHGALRDKSVKTGSRGRSSVNQVLNIKVKKDAGPEWNPEIA